MEMQKDVWYGDALCFVLANNRHADTVLQLLERYVPSHFPLMEDYEDFGVEYETEYDMLRYFELHPHTNATRHWNEAEKTRDSIMVGAYFLTDGHLVVSLTVQGNGIIEAGLYSELTQCLQSQTGLISYNYFPEFNSGAEFKALCESSSKG